MTLQLDVEQDGCSEADVCVCVCVCVCVRVELVSWCFKPNQPQRIISGQNVCEEGKAEHTNVSIHHGWDNRELVS